MVLLILWFHFFLLALCNPEMLFWWHRCISLFPLNSQQLWRWYILFWKNAECKELLRNRWRENNPLLCIIDYLWFFPPSCYISILSEKRKRDQVWMIVLSFLLEREREREKDRKTARIDRLIIPERRLREREIEIFFLVSACVLEPVKRRVRSSWMPLGEAVSQALEQTHTLSRTDILSPTGRHIRKRRKKDDHFVLLPWKEGIEELLKPLIFSFLPFLIFLPRNRPQLRV